MKSSTVKETLKEVLEEEHRVVDYDIESAHASSEDLEKQYAYQRSVKTASTRATLRNRRARSSHKKHSNPKTEFDKYYSVFMPENSHYAPAKWVNFHPEGDCKMNPNSSPIKLVCKNGPKCRNHDWRKKSPLHVIP
jgi:hypothetical protein